MLTVVAIHPLDTLLLPTTTITRYNSSYTYQHIRTDIHFILEL